MPTKKHRYTIVIDNETNITLNLIMKALKTKQRSKAIKWAINTYKEEIRNLYSIIEEINK